MALDIAFYLAANEKFQSKQLQVSKYCRQTQLLLQLLLRKSFWDMIKVET